MDIISFIALILLSLVGYSGGAVGVVGKSVNLKPQIIDLILIGTVWTGAIYSRITLNVNKWVLILVWIAFSIIMGILTISFRKLTKENQSTNDVRTMKTNTIKKLYQSWKNFSERMGNFQNRIILSLFFFIFVSPFALAMKIFSDPLKIKKRRKKSHWLPKKEMKIELEQFRRQF